jgi:RimJ/RimL family protein N-acetyltransferase
VATETIRVPAGQYWFAVAAGTVHAIRVARIPPVLSTARLILRPVTLADGPALEPLLNDPVVREMFHRAPGGWTSGDQWVAAQIEMQGLDAVPVRSYSWAIMLAGTETVIGFAQLGSVIFHTGAEPALALVAQSRREGYGLEIMNELVRWGFEDMIPDWARTSDGADTGDRLPRMTALAVTSSPLTPGISASPPPSSPRAGEPVT